MYEVDKDFCSAKEFFDFILHSDFLELSHVYDVSERFMNGYVFRGQADKDWALVPSAHRSGDNLEAFTPQSPSSYGGVGEYLKTHVHAEMRAMYLFLEAADHIGIKTPLDYSLFKGDSALGDEVFSPLLFPCLALAQHYGVPTRLLDWTESPFIAAYFAAYTALKSEREDGFFSIVCANTVFLKDLSSVTLISAPKSGNSNLRAQRGLFTLFNNSNRYYECNGRWPGLEDVVASEHISKLYRRFRLVRFSLPVTEAKSLLRLLYKIDISRLTLMPSLDSAARSLEYKRLLWG